MWVDRLEATVEAHILPTAEVREACHIPGTSLRTAWLCRDKPSMKEALREAGIPTAASAGVDSADEARAFAAAVGYPLIFKPRSGAGAAGTTRVDSDTELAAALETFGATGATSIAIEEFVEGHEGFYDTLSINGAPDFEFVSHYFPGVLEAMRTRWISPQFVSTNRVDTAADYDELKVLGRRVNEALGIGTSATHMEWFFGPKGLRFSEIGCRPSGVGAWDLYAAGQRDRHLPRVGPRRRARIDDTPAEPPLRGRHDRAAARPRTARIRGYDGVEEMQARYGEWVFDAHLPDRGHARPSRSRPGYMANAYVRMKHPDYDVLRGHAQRRRRVHHGARRLKLSHADR